jgi:hypothetical protein
MRSGTTGLASTCFCARVEPDTDRSAGNVGLAPHAAAVATIATAQQMTDIFS